MSRALTKRLHILRIKQIIVAIFKVLLAAYVILKITQYRSNDFGQNLIVLELAGLIKITNVFIVDAKQRLRFL